MPTVQLQPDTAITPQEIEQIAWGAALVLNESHWQAVQECHAFLQTLVDQKRIIYGITTGYGPLANTYIDPDASATLQKGLVYHLTSGTGPLLSKEQTRAIMAARAAVMARGYSAVNPQTLQLLLTCLEKDLIPQVPSIGTVGASGDLTPLAHIALGLMGEQSVYLADEVLEGHEAFRRLDLTPLRPKNKDALALVNGTSAMTAIAALNHCHAERLLKLSLILSGLYGELLGAHLECLQPGLAQLRPHAGQVWAQSRLYSLCQDSKLLTPYTITATLPDQLVAGGTLHNQPIPQDAYTFRCASQNLGAVKDSLDFHGDMLKTELWSVTDNPIFLAEKQEVLHGGNFFGQQIAIAADTLNNALITLAVHSERRIARITDSRLNQGLPPFLRGNNDGLHSGFMGAQVTATALVAEMRTRAIPASIQSIPTNANNQDIVTMGTLAARQCALNLEHLTDLLAIESLMLVQGMDLSPNPLDAFSSSARQFYAQVRHWIHKLNDDRPLHEDICYLRNKIHRPQTAESILSGFPNS